MDLSVRPFFIRLEAPKLLIFLKNDKIHIEVGRRESEIDKIGTLARLILRKMTKGGGKNLHRSGTCCLDHYRAVFRPAARALGEFFWKATTSSPGHPVTSRDARDGETKSDQGRIPGDQIQKQIQMDCIATSRIPPKWFSEAHLSVFPVEILHRCDADHDC